MTEPRLGVLAVLGDAEAGRLTRRVLEASGDRVALCSDLEESLVLAQAAQPDIVLVDITLRQKAGLAVVHHMKSMLPNVRVFALAPPESVALANEALSLGASRLVITPLSGDELLILLSEVRTERMQFARQSQLTEEEAQRIRERELHARVTALSASNSRREAGARLAELLVAGVPEASCLLYLGVSDGQRQLAQVAQAGVSVEMPAFCEELALLRSAEEHDLAVVVLATASSRQGFLLLRGLSHRDLGSTRELLAPHAAIVLALLGQQEQSQSGAMKDPGSSAYTFAYFVDVAGREIDKAVRHGRRFALATVVVPALQAHASPAESCRGAIVERLLGAVRDTDVVARIDEGEFFVLLPETGGLGAHACRRRVMHHVARPAEAPRTEVMMGFATFPHDGRDLSQLLRVARHRAQLSEASVADDLYAVPTMSELLDALRWNAGKGQSVEQPQAIELPVADWFGLAATAVSEALRGGKTRLLASQRPGMCMAAAVRAAVGRDSDDARVEVVDVAQVAGAERIEVLAVLAEHGAYSLLGRVDGDIMRAVHSADPMLVDLIADHFGMALHSRFLD